MVTLLPVPADAAINGEPVARYMRPKPREPVLPSTSAVPKPACVDAAMRALGYRSGGDWRSLVFDGAAHDEAAWKPRAEAPLSFLLAPAQ